MADALLGVGQDRPGKNWVRRHWISLAIVAIGLLVLLGAGWLIITGLMARTELNALRAEVRQLRAEISAGDLNAAAQQASEVGGHARRAHSLTTGPAWAVAATIPALGKPAVSARGLAKAAAELGTDALPGLISAKTGIDPATIRNADGSIKLAPITAAAPKIAAAEQSLQAATALIKGLPTHTWLGAIDHARSDLLGQLGGLAPPVQDANIAAHLLPEMLGQNGIKRYFVAFQNTAEARGTGGIPGSYAILEADNGRLSFTTFGSDDDFGGISADVNLGSDFDQLYGDADPTSKFINSNVSPNFPYTAQIWSAMWEKKSGQHIDGALAIDPTALSYLLAVTGPVTMPDKTTISAGNVVSTVESTEYSKITNPAVRKTYLNDVSKAVSEQIIHAGGGSTTALVRAAGKAAGQRRLLLWSSDPALERVIGETPLSGTIPQTDQPYVGVSVVNAVGNKLDYYLDRSLVWQGTGCGSGPRTVTATIGLTNNAPASGLTQEVTGSAKFGSRNLAGLRPGDNRLTLSYFATAGAQLESISVDGKAAFASVGSELGHPVYSLLVEVRRGQTTTVVISLVEPASTAAPIVLQQPLVNPLKVSLAQQPCK